MKNYSYCLLRLLSQFLPSCQVWSFNHVHEGFFVDCVRDPYIVSLEAQLIVTLGSLQRNDNNFTWLWIILASLQTLCAYLAFRYRLDICILDAFYSSNRDLSHIRNPGLLKNLTKTELMLIASSTVVLRRQPREHSPFCRWRQWQGSQPTPCPFS